MRFVQVDHPGVNIASYPYLVGFKGADPTALNPPAPGEAATLVDWVQENLRWEGGEL